MSNIIKQPDLTGFVFKTGCVPKIYDNLKVIQGLEEKIYDQVYVHAVTPNNRLVKLLKESVVYA